MTAIQWLISNVIIPLYNFVLPIGISFGALVVGVFGIPLLFKAFKKVVS